MARLSHTKSFYELSYAIRKSTPVLMDHSEINHALNVYSDEVYQAGIKEGRKDKEIEDSKNYKERLHRSKNYIELLEFIDDLIYLFQVLQFVFFAVGKYWNVLEGAVFVHYKNPCSYIAGTHAH